MPETIDTLLTMYDQKQLSRRELVGALLTALAMAPQAAAASSQQPAKPSNNLTGAPAPKNALFRGRIVNHVTLSVSDIEESRQFYRSLLGASVLLDGRSSAQAGYVDLLIGDSFVSLGKRSTLGVDHFAIGLDPWPGADRALEMVRDRFPKSEPRANQNRVSQAAETRSVMLKDPDGISVQLGSVRYQL
ncbi:MAG: VOC family protein [Acidimicrobiia bacterium]|nr:VOC family protein [Acidimicrobiia bacterium]